MSNCYRCGEPGHYAYDCQLNLRALDHAEHMARIAEIVGQWVAGEITREQKRCKISDENVQWHGADVPRHLVYAPSSRD